MWFFSIYWTKLYRGYVYLKLIFCEILPCIYVTIIYLKKDYTVDPEPLQ